MELTYVIAWLTIVGLVGSLVVWVLGSGIAITSIIAARLMKSMAQ